jgi:drug/metabolite transporter (DMT)-like permease
MHQRVGVIAAASSAALGGVTIATTRILVAVTDPLTLSVLRFAIAFALLLGIAVLLRAQWPRREDWPGVIVLGGLAFFVFSLLFAWAMEFTTAARAGLAFSTMPVQTMLIAALVGVEPLSLRKTCGVAVAMAGVALALATGLSGAPEGAWRGDLIMAGAVTCMSVYIIAARPYIARSDPLAFTTAGMAVGLAGLALLAVPFGDFASVARFGALEWAALAFVATGGGVVMFLLWVFALGRTAPTAAAVSVTANPVTASVAGALLLSEPIGVHLLVGLVAVIAGIFIATGGYAPPARTTAAAPARSRAGPPAR